MTQVVNILENYITDLCHRSNGPKNQKSNTNT